MSTYEEIQNHHVGSYYWSDDEDPIAEHLKLIEDVDLSEPDYSFHLLRVYVRRNDGMILWATDAGCSCPAPFEDVKVGELRESTVSTFIDTVMAHVAANESATNPVATIRRELVDALAKAKTWGAQ